MGNKETLATWSTAYINDLPDSAFLYIGPDGKKDEEGKTVPRDLRKLPYKDKDGKVDLPHLRNAISRLAQEKTDIPDSIKKDLLEKARRILEEYTKKESNSSEEINMSETENKEKLYRDVNPKLHQAKTKEEAKVEPKVVTEDKVVEPDKVEDNKVDETIEETETVEPVKKEEPEQEKPKSKKKKEDGDDDSIAKKIIKKIIRKKEKLADGSEVETEEMVDVDEPVEEEKVEPAEEPVSVPEVVEEPKEDKEDSVEDAPKVEDVAELESEKEPVEEKIEELSQEQVKDEITKTKEELSLIKEVREEISKLYVENKELGALSEKLSKENVDLKAECEKLTSELSKYKEEEEKLNAEKRAQRLEQLSAKFSKIGQKKTVEELSVKDEDVLEEFEKIVDSAIERLSENTPEPSVTTNSSAVKAEETPAETPDKVEEGPKPEEKLKASSPKQMSNKDFFANICRTMTEKSKVVSKFEL
jgi:hypothetical protein